ncbi:MAG: topoisomerase [Aquificae bacterium]|nr:topoisomerase [Aquificota bacterium]
MKFSSLEDWKNKLVEISLEENVSILVEGKKDVKVLKNFGVENIFPLKGKRFYDVLEELEDKILVILLFDLDKQGEKIFQKFFFILQREGIPVDISFREYLKQFDIEEIEHIDRLF